MRPLSGRLAVWDVDRTTGEIRWKLGGTPQAESLT